MTETRYAAVSTSSSPAPFSAALRRLYFVRFAFAAVWAALLFPASTTEGPLLTALLVSYPLFDAAAVFWQLRSKQRAPGAQVAERINVVVSVVVAIALGWASTVSIAAALAVWGAWAVGSGIPQLLAAVRQRRSGGQVPQMLSGGMSALAGAAFLAQGLRGADDIAGVGGYALLGGIFFLISAIRLSVLLRKAS
ncbi:hypothetical protein DPM19_12460 [Actinomadura craniellae]|uniref:DUF308 domain-containing protein n=1 Tax=Actinomadura craniellae TaxID=2231787 RepID=A0A365H699_9ACTN|nr:hypothetical protein [Actinomadura craniellae]RAY14579.1 hypothetical protein DPM19_12460 [Actinomadura craniellae]